MQHAIQTNFKNVFEAQATYGTGVAGHRVKIGHDGRRVIVIVPGNGAVLRDVVIHLDRAGYLD